MINKAENKPSLLFAEIPETIKTLTWVDKIKPMLALSKKRRVETARGWGLEEDGERWSEIVSGDRHEVNVSSLSSVSLLLFHNHLGGNTPEEMLVTASDYLVLLSNPNLRGIVNCIGNRLIAVLKTASTPVIDNGTEKRIRSLYQEIVAKYKQPTPEMVIEIMLEISLQFGLVVYQGEMGKDLERVRMVRAE